MSFFVNSVVSNKLFLFSLFGVCFIVEKFLEIF